MEGVVEVEDGPGQHHDVVDVEVGDDDLGRQSDPCRAEGFHVCLCSLLTPLSIFITFTAQRRPLTLEQGAYLPPGGEAALAGVLAQRRLQEEDRDAAEEEENKVRDEEDTCNQN